MALDQLAKATIINVDTGEQIPVMYNPETCAFTGGAYRGARVRLAAAYPSPRDRLCWQAGQRPPRRFAP